MNGELRTTVINNERHYYINGKKVTPFEFYTEAGRREAAEAIREWKRQGLQGPCCYWG